MIACFSATVSADETTKEPLLQSKQSVARAEEALIHAIETIFKINYEAAKAIPNLPNDRRNKKAILAAKKLVREQLKDPDSANFKHLTVYSKNEMLYVCGEVNAKNEFGGYTGFSRFLVSPFPFPNSPTFETTPNMSFLIPHFCF